MLFGGMCSRQRRALATLRLSLRTRLKYGRSAHRLVHSLRTAGRVRGTSLGMQVLCVGTNIRVLPRRTRPGSFGANAQRSAVHDSGAMG